MNDAYLRGQSLEHGEYSFDAIRGAARDYAEAVHLDPSGDARTADRVDHGTGRQAEWPDRDGFAGNERDAVQQRQLGEEAVGHGGGVDREAGSLPKAPAVIGMRVRDEDRVRADLLEQPLAVVAEVA